MIGRVGRGRDQAKLGRMKLADEEIKGIGEHISKHYRRLSNLFKRNIVLSRSSTFSLSMIGLEHLLTGCEIRDDRNVQKRDMDRVYLSTLAEKHHSMHGSAQKRLGGDGLDRWEFFEALIRIARLKFFDTGMEPNTYESFKRLFHDHLRHAYYIDPDEFRKEHLYTAECESVLSVHLHNLRTVFNHYCSISSSAFGRIMKLEEFHTMIEESKIVDRGKLSHDQAAICFVESNFTVIDEVRAEKARLLDVDERR